MMTISNKAIAEEFVKAKQRMKRTNRMYICHCLSLNPTGGEAAEVIMKRLDGHFTYVSWLEDKYPALCANMSEQDFREGRLQWLDSLIEEFSNKQD